MGRRPLAHALPTAQATWADRLRLARFWTAFLRETLGRRRLARLVRLRLGTNARPAVCGLAHLPAAGVFVLAANHYGGRRALDTIAAVLAAATLRRPDLANRYLLIVGSRAPRRASVPPVVRLARRLLYVVFRRWARYTLRIPLGNAQASVASLREWRRRASRQPCLVFPEGQARPVMAALRPGVGRWLAALEVPVLPVGVWHAHGRWQVRIGPPLRWSSRPDLRDAQLGLAIATLLPPEVAPAWGTALRLWRGAHAAGVLGAQEVG